MAQKKYIFNGTYGDGDATGRGDIVVFNKALF